MSEVYNDEHYKGNTPTSSTKMKKTIMYYLQIWYKSKKTDPVQSLENVSTDANITKYSLIIKRELIFCMPFITDKQGWYYTESSLRFLLFETFQFGICFDVHTRWNTYISLLVKIVCNY